MRRIVAVTVVALAAAATLTGGRGGAPPGSVTAEGLLRILPFHLAGGTDGFFAARFVRQP